MQIIDPAQLSSWSEASGVSETIASLARHMVSSMDCSRRDRLWPADPMVFQTNAMNLAYGACGTALFLHDVLGGLPSQARDWLIRQPIEVASYPPGLYSGIAGVAWTFAEIGDLDRGLELFRLVPMSRLAFAASDIFSGAAGWGLTALAFYLRTGEEEFRNLAGQAGDHLLHIAERGQDGMFWRDRNSELVPLGFALGGSGIALFLLYLWSTTGESRYLQAAREATDFEIGQGQAKNEALFWGTSSESRGHRPYWFRGGAGVTAALIRFAHILGEDRYLQLARKAARPCASFFSASPHLFEGLSSMGESLLDMFAVTGDSVYLDAARQKAGQTLLYRIDRPQGAAFPGRFLLRISHDYGMGGAGIGLFLHRVITLGPRRFHDILPQQLASASPNVGQKGAA